MKKVLFLSLAFTLVSASAMAELGYIEMFHHRVPAEECPSCNEVDNLTNGIAMGYLWPELSNGYTTDFVLTYNFRTPDLRTSFDGVPHAFQFHVDGSDTFWRGTLSVDADGVITFFTPASTGDFGHDETTVTLNDAAGDISIRKTRSGEDLTWSYTQPGSTTFIDLVTNTGLTPAANGDVTEGRYNVDPGGAAGGGTTPGPLATQQFWELHSITLVPDVGDPTTWDGANPPPFVHTEQGWTAGTLQPIGHAPAAATVAITKLTLDDPFDTGTASWDVVFNEPVTGVLESQFSASLGGDDAAATGTPALGEDVAGLSYTVTITGVSGASGSVGLNFTPGGAVEDDAGSGIATADVSNASPFFVGVSAPVANGWMLVFLGATLCLATAVMLSKKDALRH